MKNWQSVSDRITKNKEKWVSQYPGKYLLVCVNTGRFAIGNPKCDDGGHSHSFRMFDEKYGTMAACNEPQRDFYGISL